jgi:hypothetical protein
MLLHALEMAFGARLTMPFADIQERFGTSVANLPKPGSESENDSSIDGIQSLKFCQHAEEGKIWSLSVSDVMKTASKSNLVRDAILCRFWPERTRKHMEDWAPWPAMPHE